MYNPIIENSYQRSKYAEYLTVADLRDWKERYMKTLEVSGFIFNRRCKDFIKVLVKNLVGNGGES